MSGYPKLQIEYKFEGGVADLDWRLAIAQSGLVDAIELASRLMAHAHSGNYHSEEENYQAVAELMAVLAAALHKSVEP